MSVKLKTKGVPDNVDRYVGQKIRQARKKIGYSQEKLAEAIGLTFQQVQKYEHGVNRVSCGRILQISTALGQPITYFFPDFHTKPTDISIYKSQIRQLEMRIDFLVKKIDECHEAAHVQQRRI